MKSASYLFFFLNSVVQSSQNVSQLCFKLKVTVIMNFLDIWRCSCYATNDWHSLIRQSKQTTCGLAVSERQQLVLLSAAEEQWLAAKILIWDLFIVISSPYWRFQGCNWSLCWGKSIQNCELHDKQFFCCSWRECFLTFVPVFMLTLHLELNRLYRKDKRQTTKHQNHSQHVCLSVSSGLVMTPWCQHVWVEPVQTVNLRCYSKQITVQYLYSNI